MQQAGLDIGLCNRLGNPEVRTRVPIVAEVAALWCAITGALILALALNTLWMYALAMVLIGSSQRTMRALLEELGARPAEEQAAWKLVMADMLVALPLGRLTRAGAGSRPQSTSKSRPEVVEPTRRRRKKLFRTLIGFEIPLNLTRWWQQCPWRQEAGTGGKVSRMSEVECQAMLMFLSSVAVSSLVLGPAMSAKILILWVLPQVWLTPLLIELRARRP